MNDNKSAIIAALKERNIRISNGRRWLVWDYSEEWVVYSREYTEKNTRALVRTDSEATAIMYLMYEEDK